MTAPGIASRARQMGLPTLAQAVALILSLLAMTQPLWSIGVVSGQDRASADYAWGTRTTYLIRSATVDRIIIDLFNGPSFTEFRMRETVTNGFLFIAAAAAVLFLALAIPWVSRTPFPLLGVVLGIGSTIAGIAAALYPALAIADAYRTDNPTESYVTSFAGQTSIGTDVVTWGPAAAWYLVAAAAALAALATVVLLLRFSLPRAPKV